MIYAQLVVSGLLLGGVYALISIGLTLIFGVLRVVNFAHGEFLMLGMFAAYWLFRWHVPASLSVAAMLPGFATFGYVIYRLVIRRTLGQGDAVQIFATVGIGVILQNLALALWTGDFRTIRSDYADAVLRLGGGIQLSVPLLVAGAVAVVATLLLFLFLNRTMEGKAMRAVAQDPVAALAMAIDVDRINRRAFTIGTCCVGMAGTLLAPSYPIFPGIGYSFGLVSYVVVVLGGLGSMLGALLGGILIGLVETLSGFFIGTELKQAVYFLVFVLVLVLRPQGLFGERGAEMLGFGRLT